MLNIGGIMDFEVRVFKKIGKESFPSLKLYSDLNERPTASHEVRREVDYFKVCKL